MSWVLLSLIAITFFLLLVALIGFVVFIFLAPDPTATGTGTTLDNTAKAHQRTLFNNAKATKPSLVAAERGDNRLVQTLIIDGQPVAQLSDRLVPKNNSNADEAQEHTRHAGAIRVRLPEPKPTKDGELALSWRSPSGEISDQITGLHTEPGAGARSAAAVMPVKVPTASKLDFEAHRRHQHGLPVADDAIASSITTSKLVPNTALEKSGPIVVAQPQPSEVVPSAPPAVKRVARWVPSLPRLDELMPAAPDAAPIALGLTVAPPPETVVPEQKQEIRGKTSAAWIDVRKVASERRQQTLETRMQSAAIHKEFEARFMFAKVSEIAQLYGVRPNITNTTRPAFIIPPPSPSPRSPRASVPMTPTAATVAPKGPVMRLDDTTTLELATVLHEVARPAASGANQMQKAPFNAEFADSAAVVDAARVAKLPDDPQMPLIAPGGARLARMEGEAMMQTTETTTTTAARDNSAGAEVRVVTMADDGRMLSMEFAPVAQGAVSSLASTGAEIQPPPPPDGGLRLVEIAAVVNHEPKVLHGVQTAQLPDAPLENVVFPPRVRPARLTEDVGCQDSQTACNVLTDNGTLAGAYPTNTRLERLPDNDVSEKSAPPELPKLPPSSPPSSPPSPMPIQELRPPSPTRHIRHPAYLPPPPDASQKYAVPRYPIPTTVAAPSATGASCSLPSYPVPTSGSSLYEHSASTHTVPTYPAPAEEAPQNAAEAELPVQPIDLGHDETTISDSLLISGVSGVSSD